MKKSLLFALLPMTALLGMVGCEDTYSAAVVYVLRTDPIKMSNIGFEPATPDQPGQLPLLHIGDVNNPRNPYFTVNKEKNLIDTDKFRDPTMASDKDRQEIKNTLDSLFGTPAHPKAGPMNDGDRGILKLTEGPEGSLAKGSKLYRIHCLHCHGVTGDGRGPTARWVNPHPRDYRQGRFKFQSVDQAKAKTPHRRDLLRVLEQGIEGTAMPAFGLQLSAEDRENLVSYVIHLSLRGETEYRTFKSSFKYEPSKNALIFSDEGTVKDAVKGWYKFCVDEWTKSQSPDSLIKVGDMTFEASDMDKFKASVMRGKEIFENPPAKYGLGNNACLTCHMDYGRRSTFREDIWGTLSKPNNLLQGVYRGGRRPVDIYYRIHSGIDPSGMIAFGTLLSPDAIWDLVNFIQVLGNPTMRRVMGIYVD